jgi:hypothetical protein
LNVRVFAWRPKVFLPGSTISQPGSIDKKTARISPTCILAEQYLYVDYGVMEQAGVAVVAAISSGSMS